jgi:hypothetical protein
MSRDHEHHITGPSGTNSKAVSKRLVAKELNAVFPSHINVSRGLYSNTGEAIL